MRRINSDKKKKKMCTYLRIYKIKNVDVMFTSDRELESRIKGHGNKCSTRPCVGITQLHSTYACVPVASRLRRPHVKLNWKKKPF